MSIGTPENAVKAQIWSAVCIYVLVAIIKQRLNFKSSFYEIPQIFEPHAFRKNRAII
jgi:hypothetical protein